jgi:putative transposase
MPFFIRTAPAVHGDCSHTIFLPKAPSEIIFTASNGQDYGKPSMMLCVEPFGFKPGATRSQVWQSLIASPRKALVTAVKAVTMQEKKTKGVKRHFLVDVMGLLLCIVVHVANIQERAGAKLVLQKAWNRGLPRLQKVLADDGYSGQPMVDEVREKYSWEFESVKRTELHKFVVQPQRWVVERTIGWMNNWRALSKHYDYDSATGEAKILLASVYYLSKRLTHQEKKVEIDLALDEKLRLLVGKAENNVVAQPP